MYIGGLDARQYFGDVEIFQGRCTVVEVRGYNYVNECIEL